MAVGREALEFLWPGGQATGFGGQILIVGVGRRTAQTAIGENKDGPSPTHRPRDPNISSPSEGPTWGKRQKVSRVNTRRRS